jgi:hypothetical protein
MNIDTCGDIVACLPQGRTIFRYGRDQFAPMLLAWLVRNGWTAEQVRASDFRRLLDRGPVRAALAAEGRLHLDERTLRAAPIAQTHAWRLTLSSWGNPKHYRGQQISRRGMNLVLQLNFSNEHDAEYRRLFPGAAGPLFSVRGHAGSNQFNTIAWARLDIDLDENAALIEEIQSDWVKEADRALKKPSCFVGGRWNGQRWRTMPSEGEFKQAALEYHANVLPGFSANWEETMLAACLYFVFEEIGLKSLYLHEFETGMKLKNMGGRWNLPPRSIYTDLPRKFCFRKGHAAPRFLETRLRNLQKNGKFSQAPEFWLLSLEKPAAKAQCASGAATMAA